MKHLKSTEKLPRGTYLYITIGDRFYAGECPLIQTTRNNTHADWFGAAPKPQGKRISWRNWGGRLTQIEPRLASYYAKRDGRAVPKYWLEKPKPPVETKQSVVGTQASLTDVFKAAKQFRRRIQAEAACAKLESVYGGLGIRIAVELHKGDD